MVIRVSHFLPQSQCFLLFGIWEVGKNALETFSGKPRCWEFQTSLQCLVRWIRARMCNLLVAVLKTMEINEKALIFRQLSWSQKHTCRYIFLYFPFCYFKLLFEPLHVNALFIVSLFSRKFAEPASRASQLF
jgi:hypothetical protein